MAFELVKSAKGTSANATVTCSFASATASGNLIVLAFAADDYNGSPGAGWTQSAEMEQQTFHGGYVWWRISTGETSYSYTIGSATNSAWVIAEFSGADASPYDISEGQFTQAFLSGGSSYTGPTITPTTGERLLVAAFGFSNNTNLSGVTTGSWTNSFTAIDSNGSGGSGTNDLVGMGYRLVTGDGSTGFSTAVTPTPSQATQARSSFQIAFIEAAASGATGTLAATEAADAAAFTGDVLVQGSISGTDAADSAALTGDVIVAGSLAATEAADVAALAGNVIVTGSLTATESADAAALAGDVVVTGSMAATEGADAFAASGNVSSGDEIVGDITATEAADSASLTGNVLVSGSLAATDGADSAAIAGDVIVQGALSGTEGADSAAITGRVIVSGSMAATEAADTAALNGSNAVIGSLAASEAADALSIAGKIIVSGIVVATEAADATALTGQVSTKAALAAIEGADLASFAGVVWISGALAATEAADAVVINGRTVFNRLEAAAMLI